MLSTHVCNVSRWESTIYSYSSIWSFHYRRVLLEARVVVESSQFFISAHNKCDPFWEEIGIERKLYKAGPFGFKDIFMLNSISQLPRTAGVVFYFPTFAGQLRLSGNTFERFDITRVLPRVDARALRPLFLTILSMHRVINTNILMAIQHQQLPFQADN